MSAIPASCYLDFDNVFSELRKRDPESALRFAEQPGAWLERLTLRSDGRRRRWFELRCYLNPAGWAESIDGAQQNFGRYRRAFVEAGFEVVDCPRLAATKNAADIRITVDVLESLTANPRAQEYLIGSADSDFTPLLIRLRAAGRVTTLLSSREVPLALGAVADDVIGPTDLLALVHGQNSSKAAAFAEFGQFVKRRFELSRTPIPLATLAAEVQREMGAQALATKWFGHGSFTAALAEVGLAHSRIVDGRLTNSRWPDAAGATARSVAMPRRALPQSPQSPSSPPPQVSGDGAAHGHLA